MIWNSDFYLAKLVSHSLRITLLRGTKNQEEINYLKQIVDYNPVLFIDEIASELKDHFSKSFSKFVIS